MRVKGFLYDTHYRQVSTILAAYQRLSEKNIFCTCNHVMKRTNLVLMIFRTRSSIQNKKKKQSLYPPFRVTDPKPVVGPQPSYRCAVRHLLYTCACPEIFQRKLEKITNTAAIL